MIVLAVGAETNAYMIQGLDIVVDYWAGGGSNETIVVIDWNLTNGPYLTESHAWGYRWSGEKYLSDAISEICAAGDLIVATSSYYGDVFVNDAYYYDPSIDNDNHTSSGYSGWWWLGDTVDGGVTWTGNNGGTATEILGNGKIEGLNSVRNFDEWLTGGTTLTIPVPEPCVLAVLGLGGLFLRRRKDA